MSLEQEFQKAVETIKNLPQDGPYKPSNDEKLAFYSLYKQATIGKCNTAKPGMLDFVGKTKWEAWNKLENMSKEDAMKGYVAVLNKTEQKAKA